MSTKNPSAAVVVREHNGQPFFEAKFRYRSRQVKRRIGPAWLDRNPDTGKWNLRRKGRVPDDHYDQRGATVRARRDRGPLRGRRRQPGSKSSANVALVA